MVSNQRERILDAVLQAASQSGYAAMRIEDVIAIAGVSRRTFYDHFANKEEAFLSAYELVLEQLLSGVTAAFASGESWTSRVRRGLAAFLNLLASEPVLAQVCVVEALAAGPRALARRTEAMEAFQALLQPPKGDAMATSTAPPVAVEAIVGGIYEVIYSRVTTQRTDELPSLLPSLLHTALLPFVGADVAEAEYERTVRTAAERAIPAPLSPRRRVRQVCFH